MCHRQRVARSVGDVMQQSVRDCERGRTALCTLVIAATVAWLPLAAGLQRKIAAEGSVRRARQAALHTSSMAASGSFGAQLITSHVERYGRGLQLQVSAPEVDEIAHRRLELLAQAAPYVHRHWLLDAVPLNVPADRTFDELPMASLEPTDLGGSGYRIGDHRRGRVLCPT